MSTEADVENLITQLSIANEEIFSYLKDKSEDNKKKIDQTIEDALKLATSDELRYGAGTVISRGLFRVGQSLLAEDLSDDALYVMQKARVVWEKTRCPEDYLISLMKQYKIVLPDKSLPEEFNKRNVILERFGLAASLYEHASLF